MKAIILAAGRGQRLGAHAGDAPKCLIDICGRALLDYQLDSLRAAGVTDVVMVVGYCREHIQAHVRQHPDMRFTWVVNERFAETNTASSLWLARHSMDEDFLYLNADVLYHPGVVARLQGCPKENTLAVERKACGEEEVKVRLQHTAITAISKTVSPGDAYGEFIGVAKFSGAIAPLFIEALRQTIEEPGGEMCYFEAALDRIAATCELTAVDITDLPCIEIDFPDDLARARERVAPEIIGQSARVKILFYAERNLHLPFLEPIHDYLIANFPRVECVFSAPPYRPARPGAAGAGLAPEVLQRLREKARVVESPEDFPADVAVVADATFYDVRHCRRIVNVGHGMISKGYFYTDAPVVRRENHADLICVPGQWHRAQLARNVFSPITVTGFIKSDAWHECSARDQAAFRQRHGIPAGNTILLFAPTFNDELSALPCIGTGISELARGNTTVIVKLHGMTPRAQEDRFAQEAAHNPNLVVIDDSDFAAAMVCADVMVSDVSSAFVEFMLLDKPVVLFNNPRMQDYCQHAPDDIEYRVRDAAIEVRTLGELKLGVQLALLDPEAYRNRRREYARMLSCPIDGQCAARAAQAIMHAAQAPVPGRDLPDVSFCAVVAFQRPPAPGELQRVAARIVSANPTVAVEICCAGPEGPAPENLPAQVRWLTSPDGTAAAICDAVQSSAADFIAIVDPKAALPRNWLVHLHRYFRYPGTPGAVVAFSFRDNYRPILQNLKVGVSPDRLLDVQELFLYCLIGNEVTTDSLRRECCLIRREAFTSEIPAAALAGVDDLLRRLTAALQRDGRPIRLAPEIFAVPAEAGVPESAPAKQAAHLPAAGTAVPAQRDESPAQRLARAREFKKARNYQEAITELESARKALSGGDSANQRLARLSQAKACKQRKAYDEAIAMLEELKKSA